MVQNVLWDAGFYLVRSSFPYVVPNLDRAREQIIDFLQGKGANFEKPEWKEKEVPCHQMGFEDGHWNALEFRQKGKHLGHTIGLFGVTSGLQETYSGPRSPGDVVMIEAAVRQRASNYCGNEIYNITGRKAERTDKGSLTFALKLDRVVPQSTQIISIYNPDPNLPPELKSLLS